MDITEIKQKSISGAKWSLVLSGLSLPLTYITNIVLGRISPEALGVYTIVVVSVSIIATFVIFGGNTVIVKFLPELDDSRKLSFVFTYLLLVLLIAVAFMIALIFNPRIINVLLGGDFETSFRKYLLILIPIVLLQQVSIYTLNGLMEIKSSVICSRVVTIGNFIVFTLLYLFFRNFFSDNYWWIIWVSFLLLLPLSLLIAFIQLCRRFRKWIPKAVLSPHLPHDFWGFTAFVQAASLLSFAYDRTDQLIILQYMGLSGLGLYQSALQMALLVRFVPGLLGQVLLPTFSNLLATDGLSSLRKAYAMVIKCNTLLGVPVALICILFPREILRMFGSEYVTNSSVLAMLAAFFGIAMAGQVNASLVLARGKARLFLVNSFMQIAFQLVVTLLFVPKHGVLGAAFGKGGGLALAQIGLFLIIWKTPDLKLEIPKAFYAGVATVILAITAHYLIDQQPLVLRVLLFAICLLIVLLFGEYSKEDLHFVKRHAFPAR